MKRLSILGATALLALAGCGGSNNNSSNTTTTSGGASSGTASAGGGQQLKISADASQLKYNVTQLSAKAGKVTITMNNQSPLQHDVAIKGGGVNAKGEIVGQGGKSVATADLKAGTYEFYCSVDGHEAAGMKGELVVK
jgi:plastocyanin